MSKLANYINDSVNSDHRSEFTKVINDWQGRFPNLIRYRSGNKLIKRIGPVIIGIEIEKFLSDEYKPKFIAYNLIDHDSRNLVYIIDQSIKNRKGLDISIKYSSHAAEYIEACEKMECQSCINLTNRVSLNMILDGILTFVKSDYIGNCFWSCQAILQLSRLIEPVNVGNDYFNEGVKLLERKVPSEILEFMTGGFQNWINKTKCLSHGEIMNYITCNLGKFKLEKVIDYMYCPK